MQAYNIAGIVFAADCETEGQAGPTWQKFSCKASPQLLYRIRYAEKLPTPEGDVTYADARVRCYGACERIYSDLYTHRDTVHTLVHHDAERTICDLTVAQARAPWGVSAEQLYEVLDLPHYLLSAGRLLIHGAYILYNGKAIIFSAPSGVGKSTQAELWRKFCGAQVINGDRTLLGFDNGKLMAFGYPFSGSSDDCENVSAPIATIVFLSQAKENRIERLSATQAIAQLSKSVYLQPENRADLTAQLDFSVKIAQNIPMYHLACLPNESAVNLLRETL